MIEADESSGEVRLSLSRDFYDEESVRRCLEEFSGICSARIGGGDRIEIVLECRDSKVVPVLGQEFCNHLLAAMKNSNSV